MRPDDPDIDLDVSKPDWPNRYRWAVVYFAFLAGAAFALFIPYGAAFRSAVEFFDPTYFDPRYENFDKIKNGVTMAEVHDLLAHPPTKTFPWWAKKGHLQDEWQGTRGMIMVKYAYHYDFEKRTGDQIVMETKWVQAPR